LGFLGSSRLGLVGSIQLAALALFSWSFLQIKSPSTNSIIHKEHGDHLDTPRQIDRLVFIVIDALRQDLMYSPDRPMRFTQDLIARRHALPFIARSSPPTVTMPRLKALTAGTPPVFLDFLSNLNEERQGDSGVRDSWVRRAGEAGKRMVFLGDDTWLRLFPKDWFVRTDPTTSFYVRVPFQISDMLGYGNCGSECDEKFAG
jgi:ethanolaminephosphotransferase